MNNLAEIDPSIYLEANEYFDYNHPDIAAYCDSILKESGESTLEQVRAIYLAVRDGIPYNPYQFNLTMEQFKASDCVNQDQSYCIPKAVLFGALCRRVGVPARLGLVDVKNHISSPKLLELLQTDVLVMHGYVEIYLNDSWVKATPAFDSTLCRYIGIAPMEFDGINDSVFQEYNLDGAKHMEYLTDHGTFADVPVMKIFTAVREAYPHLDFDSALSLLDEGNSLEKDLA